MHRFRSGLLVAVLVLGAAACGGGGAHTIPVADIGKLVLRQSDVGRPFAQFNSGRQVRLDNQGTTRSDPVRNGRRGGWIARYHRAGSVQTRGPLVVESRVDLFSGADGAKADLAAYRFEFEHAAAPHARPVSVPKLGDDAAAVTYVQAGALRVRFYRIAWRDRNVSASVTVNGFDGKLTSGDAVALARRQERLIARA